MPSSSRRPSSFVSILALTLAAFAGLVAAPAVPRAHASTETLGQRAVHVASEQKGKPYRYGASGPNAFDCSGLTRYVYGRLGHHLAHNALEQYRATMHVRKADRRPGDLIFMNTSGGGTGGIDHVGIYAGHNYFWVARHSGTTITKEWIWTSHYWVGRVRS